MITQRCTVLPLVGYYFFFYLIGSFNIASASDKRFKDLEINTKKSKGRKRTQNLLFDYMHTVRLLIDKNANKYFNQL